MLEDDFSEQNLGEVTEITIQTEFGEFEVSANLDGLRKDLYDELIASGIPADQAIDLANNLRVFFDEKDFNTWMEKETRARPELFPDRSGFVDFTKRFRRGDFSVHQAEGRSFCVPIVEEFESAKNPVVGIFLNIEEMAKRIEQDPNFKGCDFATILRATIDAHWRHERQHPINHANSTLIEEVNADIRRAQRNSYWLFGAIATCIIAATWYANRNEDILSIKPEKLVPEILGIIVSFYLVNTICLERARRNSKDEELARHASRNGTNRLRLFEVTESA